MNKKIEAIWSIICSGTSTDKQTNNVSLFNVIEQLSIAVSTEQLEKAKKEGAFMPMPLECVVMLRSDQPIKDFSGKIEIIDPLGKEIFSSVFKSPRTQENKKRYRLTLRLPGIKIFGLSGCYEARIWIEGKKLSSIPIEINVTEQNTEETRSGSVFNKSK